MLNQAKLYINKTLELYAASTRNLMDDKTYEVCIEECV